jgi:fumarylacetoacetase
MQNSSSNKTSWVPIPGDSDFTLENLPFGIFKSSSRTGVGIAIGEYVVDVFALSQGKLLTAIGIPADVLQRHSLNALFSFGRKKVGELRLRIKDLLSVGNVELKDNEKLRSEALIKMSEVDMLMPVEVGNYTDFYSSEEHATNVGSMFRDPKNALLPNWKHLPVGYHGRASSIVVSGTPIFRPKGQIKSPDSDQPVFGPSQKLDFELEMAFITCSDTTLGEPVTVASAEDHIIGFVLFNDWSARDIQQWEYVPLGPFLGKNFASTISPWVVLIDALEPVRCEGPAQDPPVLPYLQTSGNRNFDIMLEVLIRSGNEDPVTLCRSNTKYLYWNIAQQLAHHTVNGCNIRVGDLYASGTISGPSSGSYGSMLELSWNGKKPLTMPDGTVRHFLEDNDTIIMKAFAMVGSTRVGFGECRGKILSAKKS